MLFRSDREFDADGRVVRETYYDKSGSVGANDSGVITVKTAYSEDGSTRELHYFDALGEPMMPESLGAYAEIRTFDQFGNVCRVQLLDAGRRPMSGAKGWATAEYVFDEEKHRLSEMYYGPDGHLTLIEGGYAGVTRIYDERGNVIRDRKSVV